MQLYCGGFLDGTVGREGKVVLTPSLTVLPFPTLPLARLIPFLLRFLSATLRPPRWHWLSHSQQPDNADTACSSLDMCGVGLVVAGVIGHDLSHLIRGIVMLMARGRSSSRTSSLAGSAWRRSTSQTVSTSRHFPPSSCSPVTRTPPPPSSPSPALPLESARPSKAPA